LALFLAKKNLFKKMMLESIDDWGIKKRKKESRTFLELLSINNIYMKKNLMRKIE